MIALHGVQLSAGERVLLDGIDARMPQGEFTCILGPNGVGKTTLLRAMAGLRPCDAGSIEIDGSSVATLTPRERARRVAYVAADDAILDALTVRDVVAIGRYAHHRWWEWQSNAQDDDAIASALQAVAMAPFEGRLFSTLSSGERQRVWIAVGLAQQAPVLLLDEPTSHLDVRVAHAILKLLRDLAKAGTTIVCVLHDLNEAAAYAGRLMLLGCGTLLATGTARDVLRPQLIERAYGIAVEAVETRSGPRVFPA